MMNYDRSINPNFLRVFYRRLSPIFNRFKFIFNCFSLLGNTPFGGFLGWLISLNCDMISFTDLHEHIKKKRILIFVILFDPKIVCCTNVLKKYYNEQWLTTYEVDFGNAQFKIKLVIHKHCFLLTCENYGVIDYYYFWISKSHDLITVDEVE
jgi:hypothetical protein